MFFFSREADKTLLYCALFYVYWIRDNVEYIVCAAWITVIISSIDPKNCMMFIYELTHHFIWYRRIDALTIVFRTRMNKKILFLKK